MGSSSSSSIAPEEGDEVRVNVSRLPGFGFSPSDELLIKYYLKNKIEGKDSLFRHLFPELDDRKYEPFDIPEFVPEVNEREWIFFTSPKYKDTRCPRRDRLTHHGYFKVTGVEREIKAKESGAVIGMKIILTFYEGRGPKAKKSDWVMHEYYCTKTEVGSIPTKQMDFVLCRLKNKSASYKKLKVDPTRGELADSGANPEDDQAAASDVIAGLVEHLGYKELRDVNSSESPDGSCSINWNDILTYFYGDDETGSCKVSDVEFCSALGEIPNSTSQPPQTPEPHQPPHSHQPQDYYPSTHQPPEYIISTNEPNEPVSKPNGVQHLGTNEMIPEDCFHPDEFMGLPFDPSHPDEFMGLPFNPSQDYLLPSPMNMELGDGVHHNNLYWMH